MTKQSIGNIIPLQSLCLMNNILLLSLNSYNIILFRYTQTHRSSKWIDCILLLFPYWFYRQVKLTNNKDNNTYIDCNLSFVHVRSQATLTGWTCWVSRSKHHKYRVYLHRLFCRTIHPRDTRRVSKFDDGITSRRRVFVRVSIIFSHYILWCFIFVLRIARHISRWRT